MLSGHTASGTKQGIFTGTALNLHKLPEVSSVFAIYVHYI